MTRIKKDEIVVVDYPEYPAEAFVCIREFDPAATLGMFLTLHGDKVDHSTYIDWLVREGYLGILPFTKIEVGKEWSIRAERYGCGS